MRGMVSGEREKKERKGEIDREDRTKGRGTRKGRTVKGRESEQNKTVIEGRRVKKREREREERERKRVGE